MSREEIVDELFTIIIEPINGHILGSYIQRRHAQIIADYIIKREAIARLQGEIKGYNQAQVMDRIRQSLSGVSLDSYLDKNIATCTAKLVEIEGK